MKPERLGYSGMSAEGAMPMRCLLFPLLYSFALPLAAQQPTHACAGVAEAAARLACYDEAFPPPPAVIEAATAKAQADFGLEKRRGEALRNPGQTVDQAEPERIQGRVTRVDHGSGGQRTFHLENGQAWALAEARSIGQVREGDVVQVRKAMLSGYTLVAPNGVTLRVRRVR